MTVSIHYHRWPFQLLAVIAMVVPSSFVRDAAYVGATTATDLLQFNSAVPVTVAAGDAVAANYESALHNAEINLSYECYCNVDFLVGFRYLELNERGTVDLVNAAVPFTYSVAAKNRLYGAQLGTRAVGSNELLYGDRHQQLKRPVLSRCLCRS